MSALEAVEAPAPALFARQAIMDANFDVVAYELLYRTPAGAGPTPDTDAEAATASVLVDVLLQLGLQRIAGSVPVHVNFPASMLEQIPTLAIPPAQLVVEVLEDTRATPEVVEALQSLRGAGYRVAFDDYVPGRVDDALLACVDMVKIDLGHLDVPAALRVAEQMRGRGITCIAEKVETREQLDRCAAGGIGLHQGYFLQRPETFFGHRAPVGLMAAMRLLLLLPEDDWDPRQVERLIGSDASLAWHVLRAVQSAQLYLAQRIENLAQAVIVLGRDHILRIVALLLLCRCGERPRELIHTALLRARVMELLASHAHVPQGGTFFMTGLLSLMPALLGCPSEQALGDLPLSPEVHAAVLEGRGQLGAALACAIALERAQWDAVHFAGLPPAAIRAAYLDACLWLQESSQLLGTT